MLAFETPSADRVTATASHAAGRVRPFEPDDVPAVADLYMRAYRRVDRSASPELRRYVMEAFLTDPWRRLDVSPSLVHEGRDGRTTAFLGAHPRRFIVAGREITASAMGQMMVDPNARRSGIARRLGQAMIAGPQALTFGTTASAEAAMLWRSLGFWNPAASGMTWRRTLERPPRFPSRRWFAERLAAGDRRFGSATLAVRAMIGAEEWCGLTRLFADDRHVSPNLDDDHARWIWSLLGQSRQKGRAQGWVVERRGFGTIGWWVGLLDDAGRFRVLDTAVTPNHVVDAVAALIAHGEHGGWTRIEGVCTSPALTAAVVACGARLHAGPGAHVYFAADPAVRAAVHNAGALISELHSESWLSFAER
ncbi:MAG: GNAT family N-acetyltransferase [Phycisphaerales bacterium]|nr:GNAT family N-acetyltransferase [Phycisphaerales bacterium]